MTNVVLSVTVAMVKTDDSRLNILARDDKGEEIWCLGSLRFEKFEYPKSGERLRLSGDWITDPHGSRVLFFANAFQRV